MADPENQLNQTPENKIPVPPESNNPVETPDYALDYRSFEESRLQRLKAWFSDFFSDRRKVLIAGAAFLFLAAGLITVLIIRSGGDSVSQVPGDERGNLPLVGKTNPDFIPQVFRPGNGTIVVEWSLDRPTDGRVDYGTSNKYSWFADDPNTLTPEHFQDTHRVVL